MKYLLLLGLVFLSKNSFSQTDLAKKVITQLKLDKADWQVDFYRKTNAKLERSNNSGAFRKNW
jgi:hypothetical protein